MKGLVTLMRCTRLLSCITLDKSPDVLASRAHVRQDVALTFLHSCAGRVRSLRALKKRGRDRIGAYENGTCSRKNEILSKSRTNVVSCEECSLIT